MFYVYLLKDSNNQVYIGSTKDLRRRLKEHQMGKTFTTRHMDSIKLYYYEAYLDEESARIREKKLKQYGSAYHALKKRIGLNIGL